MRLYQEHSWNQGTKVAVTTSILEKCVLLSYDEVTSLNDVSFWLDGIVILVVAFFGILLNVPVIFFFLTKRNMKGLFNVMFVSLLCFDTLSLVVEILTSLHDNLGFVQTHPPYLLANRILPSLGRFNLTTIILIHIAISVERYLGTLYPFRHRSTVSRRRLVKIYAPVVIISGICTIPAFFETTAMQTRSTEESYIAIPTSLNLSTNYNTFYMGIVRGFILGIVPIGVLVLLNLEIFTTVPLRKCWRKKLAEACGLQFDRKWDI